MPICDLCSCSIGKEAKRYTAPQIKKAIRGGLRPPKDSVDDMATGMGFSQEDLYLEWKKQVMNDTSDWLLCPKCASRTDKYLKKKQGLFAFFKKS